LFKHPAVFAKEQLFSIPVQRRRSFTADPLPTATAAARRCGDVGVRCCVSPQDAAPCCSPRGHASAREAPLLRPGFAGMYRLSVSTSSRSQ
jgi:1-acyl-sn-glycerol-3-phosphate acyltransferase